MGGVTKDIYTITNNSFLSPNRIRKNCGSLGKSQKGYLHEAKCLKAYTLTHPELRWKLRASSNHRIPDSETPSTHRLTSHRVDWQNQVSTRFISTLGMVAKNFAFCRPPVKMNRTTQTKKPKNMPRTVSFFLSHQTGPNPTSFKSMNLVSYYRERDRAWLSQRQTQPTVQGFTNSAQPQKRHFTWAPFRAWCSSFKFAARISEQLSNRHRVTHRPQLPDVLVYPRHQLTWHLTKGSWKTISSNSRE